MDPPSKGQTTMSSNLSSQELSSTNKQPAQVDLLPRFHSALPSNWGSQQWMPAARNFSQDGMQLSVPFNWGSYQLMPIDNQAAQIQQSQGSQSPMPVFLGSNQFSSSNLHTIGPQPLQSLQPYSSLNLVSQPSSSVSKRPAQFRTSAKLQNVTGSNKRPAQSEPPLKVRSESFESVRAKLRESLAAALGLVSDQQNKQQVTEIDSTSKVEIAVSEGVPTSAATSASGRISSETLISNEPVQKHSETQSLTTDASLKERTSNTLCDVQESQKKHVYLEDEVPGDNSVVKDEFLLGHGLCWVSDADAESVDAATNHEPKRLKMSQEKIDSVKKEESVQIAEKLAFSIEAGLFRLFGGVNKKYKEKGRSLLFNLKDRSNPELRERVMSGEISPKRICTMTAEELASKELSQWRLAKAEELAQMVVLPDSEVDVRRLVKKTHKGEFQVEVEQADSVSVEVELGTTVRARAVAKSNEIKIQSRSINESHESKASENVNLAEKVNSDKRDISSNMDTLLQEKTDLMQELMVDEVKDPELLPPVVSLDEFMEALDSEPPFENLPVGPFQDGPCSETENIDSMDPDIVSLSNRTETKPELASKLDSSKDVAYSELESSREGVAPMSDLAGTSSADLSTDKVDFKNSPSAKDLKSDSVSVQSETCPPEVASTSEKIWEGLVQLNISALATVVGLFKSGEKTSTQEWPSFLEIKGRVKLEAFEKFLKDLPLSRSRAVMIAQFCWKEGSPESGRKNLSEISELYVADERVGFSEPVAGVELYFCPSHPRTTEMLGRYLQEEHTEALQTTIGGLIGVVVWRRPQTTISPRIPPQHKHGSAKQQSSSRKQQNVGSNPTSTSSMPSILGPPPANAPGPPSEDDTDDVPPGFGPKDDDDLPEFDFVHGRSQISKPVTLQPSGLGMSHSSVLPPARPVDQIRELIHKYGHSENVKNPSIEVQPWNDDDDIPEWQPNRVPQPPQAQAAPPSPPPPPPSQQPQIHTHQLQSINLQPLQPSQNFLPLPPHQLRSHPHPQPQQVMARPPLLPQPLQFQLPLQPQMGMIPGPLNLPPGWQPSQWLPISGPVDFSSLPPNNVVQPSPFGGQSLGQVYGLPNLGAGVYWRPDIPRNGGV